MAWMSAENETKRIVWSDRDHARPGHVETVRREGREWVTIPATRPTMTDWRRGSSRVVES